MTTEYQKRIGPLLIVVAASLWAFDALLRTRLTGNIPVPWIVFLEHLIGVFLLTPFLWKHRSTILSFSKNKWLHVFAISSVSSVLGTILFTAALAKSFALHDFASPVLLQKLQPLFVILLARFALKESISLHYMLLLPAVFIGSYLVSFGASPVSLVFDQRVVVYLLAVGAAAAWGSGTVLSRAFLKDVHYELATGLRFAAAVPISLLVALTMSSKLTLSTISLLDISYLAIIAFTTGAGALLLYYRGLSWTEAKVATIGELAFPVISLIIAVTALNPYGAPQQLSLGNIFGVLLLVTMISAITFDYSSRSRIEV